MSDTKNDKTAFDTWLTLKYNTREEMLNQIDRAILHEDVHVGDEEFKMYLDEMKDAAGIKKSNIRPKNDEEL